MASLNLVGNALTGSTGTGKFVGDTNPTFSSTISLPSNPGAFPAASIVMGPVSASGAVRLIASATNSAQTDGTGIAYQMATGVLGNNYQDAYIWQRYSTSGDGGAFIVSKGRGTSANPIVYDDLITIENNNGAATITIGNSSATSNTCNIYGVTTGTTAAAGVVGQLISSTLAIGSATALTTATAKTVTSISLTAGDWDVWGNIGIIAGSGTLVTNIVGSISDTTNTQATSPNGGAFFQKQSSFPATTTQINSVGMVRINISSTTTYYLVATADFTVSTCTAYGFIGARRRR